MHTAMNLISADISNYTSAFNYCSRGSFCWFHIFVWWLSVCNCVLQVSKNDEEKPLSYFSFSKLWACGLSQYQAVPGWTQDRRRIWGTKVDTTQRFYLSGFAHTALINVRFKQQLPMKGLRKCMLQDSAFKTLTFMRADLSATIFRLYIYKTRLQVLVLS